MITMQIVCLMRWPKAVREGITGGAHGFKLCASLLNQLIVVVTHGYSLVAGFGRMNTRLL